MKIYTRTGDRGETSLFGGTRVSKSDPRIEAYGTVDELNSFLGAARAHGVPGELETELERAQNDLFEIGAQLASPGTDRFRGVDARRTSELEAAIDALESHLPALTSFVLPGGSAAAARLHVARTVCRRAERAVVALGEEAAADAITYLNRLSDYLFVAARFANRQAGAEETTWRGR